MFQGSLGFIDCKMTNQDEIETLACNWSNLKNKAISLEVHPSKMERSAHFEKNIQKNGLIFLCALVTKNICGIKTLSKIIQINIIHANINLQIFVLLYLPLPS